jgi:hypothetical protein
VLLKDTTLLGVLHHTVLVFIDTADRVV